MCDPTPEPTPAPTPRPFECPRDAYRCEKPGEEWKYSLFRQKSDGSCEYQCVKHDYIEKKLSEGFGCEPCYKTCSPEPLRCEKPEEEWKYTLFRQKSDGSCEVKCEKADDLVKKQSEGFSCEPCANTPDIGADTCETCGKPKYLSFLYETDNCVGTSCNSQEPAGKADVSGSVGAGTVSWAASEDENCSSNVYGRGSVSAGEAFSIATNDKWSSNMYICLTGNGSKQTIRFHTSCSAPIVEGDQFGHLTLVGFSSDSNGPAAGCGFGY